MWRYAGPLCLFLLTALLTAASENLGAEKLIEELEASNETQVHHYEVKTKDGSQYNETVVIDRERSKKLVVSRKDGKEEQILYEDCEKNLEYIVTAPEPESCFVHYMTDDERVRNCVEKTRSTYKTSEKADKDMTETEVDESMITDTYKKAGKSPSNLESPPLCENRKLVGLVPELIGKAGKPENSGSEEDRRLFSFFQPWLCCCSRAVTQSYCCRYCRQSGWWGYRRTYCCGGTCIRRTTVRRCKRRSSGRSRCHC